VDHVLILEGPQGKMKSTACRVLAGEWFSDHLPPIATAGKDVSQHLRGKWLIEIAEMNAMDKAASAALKAFITRDTERYRASFGRRESVEPRQCVFIITTNEKEYLRDPTGARRYWPDKVGTIDIDALKRDRDQLFAEAVHEFNAGTPWWPDREFEREHAHPQQEARYEADVWEEKISVWLAEQRYTARQNGARARVTVGQVAMECLKFEVAKIGTHDTRRITAALTRLGWDREFGDGTDSRGRRPWICLADGIAETVEV
jgi:predicted P-loop ATPase